VVCFVRAYLGLRGGFGLGWRWGGAAGFVGVGVCGLRLYVCVIFFIETEGRPGCVCGVRLNGWKVLGVYPRAVLLRFLRPVVANSEAFLCLLCCNLFNRYFFGFLFCVRIWLFQCGMVLIGFWFVFGAGGSSDCVVPRVFGNFAFLLLFGGCLVGFC